MDNCIKRIKYPGINFIKEKRHKTLIKKLKKTQGKLKDIPYSQIGRMNTGENSTVATQYRFNSILV